MRTVEKIETAVEPRFQQHFVDAMAFPHRTAAYPHLSKVTELPKRQGDGATAAVVGPRNPGAGDARRVAATREDR